MLHHAILEKLTRGPLSLSDLQAVTSVSLPTLRKAVQELTDARWIRIVGQAEANGGRPAMLFGLDTHHYLVIAVHLQLPAIHLVTADLLGNVLHTTDAFDTVTPTPSEAIQTIIEYVSFVRAAFSGRTVLGMGIATPGFIDAATGDILTIGRVRGWQNFPICRRLQSLLDMPVYVANDIDCMAFAEFHHSNGLDDRNLAYVGFDEGVKVSLFLRGELYKSNLGNAGLVAASLLNVRGVASAEDVKDLLTLVGISQLLERRVEALPPHERTAYTPILALSARQRAVAILQKNLLPLCQELSQQIASAVAAAVAYMVWVIQPDHIVMGGVLSHVDDAVFRELRRAISAHLPSLIDHHITLQQATFSSPSNAAIGAVHHFLQNYIDQTDVSTLLLVDHREG